MLALSGAVTFAGLMVRLVARNPFRRPRDDLFGPEWDRSMSRSLFQAGHSSVESVARPATWTEHGRMRDLLPELDRWYGKGQPAGLATVVRTEHSAPLPAGTAMAVSAAGQVIGSVSGGCVEAAVYQLAQQVVADGRPVLRAFDAGTSGRADQGGLAEPLIEPLEAGLTCGGTVEVFVEPFSTERFPQFPQVSRSVSRGEPVALATVLSDGGQRPSLTGHHLAVWPDRAEGTLGELTGAVTSEARAMLHAGGSRLLRYGPAGQPHCADRPLTVFVQSFAPPPRLLVFGAVDFAAALARVGRFLGYQVTVCDARPVFATPERFPDAHEVVVEWPHRYLERTRTTASTVVCVLTHEPRFDVPLLAVALRGQAGYVGAMGSRRTHVERLERLRAAGLDEEQLARLRSPIGLDLGGRTPEETALSIVAEIVASRCGGSGLPLSASEGPIHRG